MDDRRNSSTYTYCSNNLQNWNAQMPSQLSPGHSISHRTSESYSQVHIPRALPSQGHLMHPNVQLDNVNPYSFDHKSVSPPSCYPRQSMPTQISPERQMYSQYSSHPYRPPPNHLQTPQYLQNQQQYVPPRQPETTQYPASPPRPFSCDMCALSFNRQHDLKRHRETHSGDKPFPCEACGKSFTRKDALKRHQTVKKCGNIKPE